MQLTTNEKLAVLTAMSKQVKSALDEVRKEAEEQMAERFDKEGVDRARLMLDGEEVGSVTVRSDRKGWEVCDREAYDEFLRDNGQMRTRHVLRPEHVLEAWIALGEERPWMFEVEERPDPDFEKAFERVGDAVVVSGTDVVVPGVRPCRAKAQGIMVRGCTPRQVAPIALRMGGLDALLLGEGEAR